MQYFLLPQWIGGSSVESLASVVGTSGIDQFLGVPGKEDSSSRIPKD